ncbi:MAG: hypothetical protein ACJ8F7_08070 [Gemmataceae bacterium]
MRPTRRGFLQTAAGASLLGLGDLGFLSTLPRVSADDARLDPKLVRIQPDIEPLVRLLEDTPRQKLIEEVGHRVRNGTTYRELLAALLLAGVRNIQPRPVGFKFHAVLVVNSAHLASLNSPDEHRWLPIFWALDNFKNSQAQNEAQGGWRLKPVDESKVPTARNANKAFAEAMANWDEAAADVAAASVARNVGVQEAFREFARVGCRDFRDIGHKAIYVANAFRTLQCIGWQYAEPVLRSLAYALLEHNGDNPAKRDDPADRPGRLNLARLAKLPEGWQEGKPDAGATDAVLAVIRDGSEQDSCEKVMELLAKGVSPRSIWDGLLCGAGELLMRQPGIVGLHTLTTANALHYSYETCEGADRALMMLQCAAFLPMFHGAMKGRKEAIADVRIDKLEPLVPKGDALTPTQIFADVGRDRAKAAAETLGYLKSGGDAKALIDTSRVLTFLKGRDSHDYKFSSAVLEDYYHVSPAWRDRFLAAGTYWLQGSGAKDNDLVKRTRAALQG